MEPTIHCGRPKPGCEGRRNPRVRVRAYGEDRPERGDIVALQAPPRAEEHCGFGGVYFKRVIALPGQTWEEKAGVIYVNGRQLSAPPSLAPERLDRTPSLHHITSGYFVLGDSRAHSCDSREWGPAYPGQHPWQGRQDQPVMPTPSTIGANWKWPRLICPVPSGVIAEHWRMRECSLPDCSISHWAMRSRAGVGGSPCLHAGVSRTGRAAAGAAVRARCPKRLGEGTGMAQHASRDRYGRCPGCPFPTASTYGARSSASSTSRLSVPDSFAE